MILMLSPTPMTTAKSNSACLDEDVDLSVDPTTDGTSVCGQTCDETCKRSAGTTCESASGKTAVQMLSCLQIGAGWFSEQSGGLERYYHDLLRHLPDAGVKPLGLVVGSDRVAIESGGTVKAFAPASESAISRLRSLKRAAKAAASTRQFDLVASHFALYGMPALSVFRRVPWVVHFHGPWAAEARANRGGRLGGLLKHAVERRVYKRGTRFITLSRAFGRILEQQYRMDPTKIRVVPGGVDSARFSVAESRAEARAGLGWPIDRPIVLTVRRLVPRMGLENLIDAAARPEFRDTLFLIAGKGPLTDSLRERIKTAGVEERVRLLGYVPDDQLPAMYRAADLTAVPSVALEGFGLTVVESLMSGTPAMVTPVGGLPEVIEAFTPELITEGSGSAQLADGLRRALLGNVKLPDVDACRHYAMSRFDWRTISRQVRDVYAEAVAAN